MKRKVVVAVIQMEIKPLDNERNLLKIKELVDQVCKKSKIDLIVLPEDCITGPIPRHLNTYCLNEDSVEVSFIKKLAIQLKVFIVAGSFIEKIGVEYFNTSLLIDDKGKVLIKYKKNHLWHPEKHYLTAGKKVEVVQTKLGKIGIVICWDLAFSEIFQRLQKLGAEIICIPSYWTKQDGGKLKKKYDHNSEEIFVNSLCSARAIETGALVVYANGAGLAEVILKSKNWKGIQIGQSQICSPVFGCVQRLNDNKEGFVIYEYDRNLGRDAEKHYRIRDDLLAFEG